MKDIEDSKRKKEVILISVQRAILYNPKTTSKAIN